METLQEIIIVLKNRRNWLDKKSVSPVMDSYDAGERDAEKSELVFLNSLINKYGATT